MTQRLLILYHANCADGFCAAWVAQRKFGDRADYLPVNYGQEPPVVAGCNVYILDFSYKRPVMEAMRKSALTLVVLDHHKTAQAELEGFGQTGPYEETNVCCVFDMNKSGGRLAWEYFFPGMPSPWLVDYTEDRDLWRWNLPESRAVSAALASLPATFKDWNILHAEHHSLARLMQEGKAILRYQSQQIESQCQNAVEIEMDGHKVLTVNATMLISEITGKLAEGRPFGTSYFLRGDGKKVWSLRSRGDGVDVSEIAKRRGGGGHRNAAGFEE